MQTTIDNPGPIARSITAKLESAFAPEVLEVINESSMHSVPPGSESHFKVVIVSDAFSGQSPVARHRTVNQALASEISNGLHALSIEARSPTEWAERRGQTTDSPPCLGGSKTTRKKSPARRVPDLQRSEEWADRSPNDHDRALQSACRAAAQLLADAPDPEEHLHRADPVPASTTRLLRALARSR